MLLRKLDAPSIDILGAHKIFQQCAVAAADIQHACAPRNHLGDRGQVGAQMGGAGLVHAAPSACATALRKPCTVSNISGSSSRKESCPLSVLISTKLTLAATALRACAIRLFSAVGKSQSEVKEIMQNRTGESRNASASWPA